MRKIDWTGQTFYNLTFIKPTDKRRGEGKYVGGIIWEAHCSCGNIFYLEPIRAKTGACKSCGCHRQLVSSQGKNRKHDPIISSAKYVWSRAYKDCDFDLFLKMSQDKCFYCGRLPYRTFNKGNGLSQQSSDFQKENGNFTYNGLDRIDSSIGHTSENIVSCCTQCNIAKLDLARDDFYKMIKLIYENLNLRSCIE